MASLHAGVHAAWEYYGLIYTLKEMQNDKASGSTASGLLKKISHNKFSARFNYSKTFFQVC